ncbi:hypothetical protein CPC197_0317B, partial [Chlamydia psittaci C1/97]
SFPHQRK